MNSRWGRAASLLACISLLLAGQAPTATAGGVAATVVANPLSLHLDVPDEVESGRRFRVVATVANAGTPSVADVTLTLHTPAGVHVHRDATASIKRIRGGGSGNGAWQLCAEPIDGGYILMVSGEAVGIDGDTYPVASDAALLIVVEGRRPCR